MCGLAGLYSFEHYPDRVQMHGMVRDMTDALHHRGPDSADVWQDPDVPFAFGHRRLSILDLSASGHQPMESQSGRYMIAYNGEIYNFKELRSELVNTHKTEFKGTSDTEVLLAAIENWGLKDTLEKINGMFAFALWDRKSRALFLARDRFGKKPLYVGWSGSTLVFGSELKSLCKHVDFCPDVDRGALTSYMRFGYVPAPMTIYNQVWQLPPASMMAVDMRMLRGGQDLQPLMEYYWSAKDALIEAQEKPLESESDCIAEFENILSDCVSDRMISDVPLGAFLSGGIDSSTIVALMQQQSTSAINTYSIGFDEHGYNEAHHAKEIAKHLGTNHHELYVKAENVLDVVSHLPEIYDEPFADTSAIPTYLVSKFARESVTVALSGDGGDEMLGGYNRHITGPKAWNITQNHIPPNLRNPFSKMIQSVSPKTWDRLRPNRPQFGSHMHKFANILSKKCEGDVYLSLVSNWQKPKNIVRNGREGTIPLVDENLQIEGLGFTESMMYWDVISYLNGDILTKVDRASMAVSLEARAPLLDRRIYDYVWRLPLDMKIKNGQGKWLLRQVLKNHIPDELFNRPKQGFSVPIAEWLRGDLKDWAEDLLDEYELRAAGLLDYVEIRRIWDEHQKGRGNYAARLWTVLMFQAWYRKWVHGS